MKRHPHLTPEGFRDAFRQARRLLPNASPQRIAEALIPRNVHKGIPQRPGSGLIRGRDNIAKSITWRVVRAPV